VLATYRNQVRPTLFVRNLFGLQDLGQAKGQWKQLSNGNKLGSPCQRYLTTRFGYQGRVAGYALLDVLPVWVLKNLFRTPATECPRPPARQPLQPAVRL